MVFLYPCLKFPCANAVFVPIVAVHSRDVAVGVGVALPAAAVIDYIVDTPDRVLATNPKGYGIVLTVLGSGEIDGAEQGGEESAGST